MSALFVYGMFLYGCVAGVARPWIGLVMFYVFVVLEPTWNWRWAIDPYFPYQKYIGGAVLCGFALTGFRRASTINSVKWGIVGILGFLALAYLSAFQSINTEYSYQYMDFLWKIVLMALLTIWVIDTPEKIMTLAWAVVLCSGYNAYQINLQYFQDGFSAYAHSAWGVKGDNNLYSIFTLPVMAVSISLSVYGKKLWNRGLAGFIFVLQMHMLMLLESRGSMIGGLFLACVFAYLVPKTPRVWMAMSGSVLVGILLAGPSVVEEFSSAFEGSETRDSSASSRFEVWHAGIVITADHPLLGVGPNAGRFLVPAFVPSETRDQKALHNLFFEISTGCGLPATICYFTFFGLVWWQNFRQCRLLKRNAPDWVSMTTLAVGCGIPGYMLASMFSSGALLESSYLLIAFGAIGLSTYKREQAQPVHAETASFGMNPSGIFDVSASTVGVR
ncbi:MAG: O-antigen ligase family protein [Planctomycetota bacterium]